MKRAAYILVPLAVLAAIYFASIYAKGKDPAVLGKELAEQQCVCYQKYMAKYGIQNLAVDSCIYQMRSRHYSDSETNRFVHYVERGPSEGFTDAFLRYQANHCPESEQYDFKKKIYILRYHTHDLCWEDCDPNHIVSLTWAETKLRLPVKGDSLLIEAAISMVNKSEKDIVILGSERRGYHRFALCGGLPPRCLLSDRYRMCDTLLSGWANNGEVVFYWPIRGIDTAAAIREARHFVEKASLVLSGEPRLVPDSPNPPHTLVLRKSRKYKVSIGNQWPHPFDAHENELYFGYGPARSCGPRFSE